MIRRRAASVVGFGALCGLAWASALRSVMSEVAGEESSVHWYGTFVQVLLPGAVVGGLLGRGWQLGPAISRRRVHLLAASPMLFAAAVFVSPEVLSAVLRGEPLLEDGIGGGAIAIPLFAMAGGYAIGGHQRPLRLVLGIVALVPLPAWAVAAPVFGDEFALTTPRGLWLAVSFWTLIALLEIASAIPHLALRAAIEPSRWEADGGAAAAVDDEGGDAEVAAAESIGPKVRAVAARGETAERFGPAAEVLGEADEEEPSQWPLLGRHVGGGR